MKCGYNQFTEPEHRQVSPILSKSYDWSLTLFSKGVSQLLGVSWDVHLSSTVFCDHLISGCTCRCDVARQPRDDSESPLNACLWERSLKKLQFIQITLDEKLKHLCCISISIVGYGFLHSNVKKRFMSVLKHRNLLLCVQEVPSSLTVRRHFHCSHLQKRHKKLTT